MKNKDFLQKLECVSTGMMVMSIFSIMVRVKMDEESIKKTPTYM